jgi:cell division transport system ATP-binding protein
MITFKNVSHVYKNGNGIFDVNLHVEPGEFVYLIGPTGSGKTTIMRLIYMDLFPQKGIITVKGYNSKKFKKRHVPKLRRDIGMIFQEYKLLEDRNLFENVALPLHVIGKNRTEIYNRVMAILMEVGLDDKIKQFPNELSGGELQRACIARGLIKEPHILLADEPTGNLDPSTAFHLIKLLEKINKNGTSIFMASHNYGLIKDRPARFIEVQNGIVRQ